MNRREFLGRIGGAAAAAAAMAASPAWSAGADKRKGKPNVLFIAVDDLRPQLGCYGQKQIISPNIDKLATWGTLFNRAYCQQAVCAPSRASLMTGCRPDTTRIYNLDTPLRTAMPDVLSLAQHFKNNGYVTMSMGKIYHHRSDDNRIGWSVPAWSPRGSWKGRGYMTEAARKRILATPPKGTGGGKYRRGVGPAYEAADVADDAYPDGVTCEKALAEIKRLKDRPFFLAVGFVKPHLPFNAPKKYWDMYDRAKITVPQNRNAPKDAPPIAMTNWGELRGYVGMPARGPVSDDEARALIHGYYACVTYIGALVGKLMGQLDGLGLRDNTVVILWGDHGWKLGEYGSWCKHTNFELDTHVPLVLAAPGHKGKQRTDALVEFVDIYPTLSDLCGLEIPKQCEGSSMVPLLRDPKRKWKAAAFSQYPRGRIMGYSMRTARYRYTEWRQRQGGKVVARELYDIEKDPGANANVVSSPEKAGVVAKHAEIMKKGWRGVRKEL